jgi:TolB-like protein
MGMALAGIVAVALIAVAAGVWQFLGGARSVSLAAPTVAVLPFDNLGGDEQASRLADGMTEDVITNLARNKDILVIARNSTMPYKGRPVDARQIAKDLNVRYVLAGSIQHQANQLRVTAVLIDAGSGVQMWSERWDRPAQDLFSIQAEVADKVASSLLGNGSSNFGAIQGGMLSEAKKRTPANLSAYDFWLLAREQRMLFAKAAVPKGFEYVNKAIALDPSFANAYANRAWLRFQKLYLLGASYDLTIKEADADIQQALQLDPSNADAHACLIHLLGVQGRWAELAAEIDHAVHLNPTHILVLVNAAQHLAYLGRPEEAVTLADLALRIDPQMPPGRRDSLFPPYFFDRKFERTIEQVELIRDESRESSDRFFLAASYAFLGRTEDAERAKADLIAKNGEQVMEIWFNEGEVFARTSEQDIEREGFRKLGLRICATEEELKKYDNPKRLPECLKT